MKFSCAIFFFVLTIGAQFQRTQTAISAELAHFKQTLDEASSALENVDDDTPTLNGNADLQQRQRRQTIDDLNNNADYELNLNLERETDDMENDLMHPLEGRAIKNDNRNNDDEYQMKQTQKTNVNDQLNELVRANSRFQNLHRQLLNSFHNSNRNMKFDGEQQKTRGNSYKHNKNSNSNSNSRNKDTYAEKESKESKKDKLYTDKGGKGDDREKNTNKGKESNSYSNNNNKNSKEKNSFNNFDYSNNKDNRYFSNYNMKSNFGTKNAFNSGVDYSRDDAISSSYTPSFSNFNSMDSFKGNGKSNNYRTNAGLNAMDSFSDNVGANKGLNGGATMLQKAYISCKPLSSNTARAKPDLSYLNINSDFRNPTQYRESAAPNTNLHSNLLLEGNLYRNGMQGSPYANRDPLVELNEKKVDPEMRRMMEQIKFPHFRLDFDSSMEDFQRSKTQGDEDEPISYEKTIENIHFPSIVNDQFDLGRNDLSHEADYKLSKIEQEQSEPRKSQTRSDGELQKVKVPWKRGANFDPMDEIKLKTSTRLMAKGLGASLPSYALYENQNELQLNDAVKKLEENFDAGNELGLRGYYRHQSLLSEDELDWLERLKNMEGADERSLSKLIHEGEDDAPKEEKEVKVISDKDKAPDDLLFGPTYSVLRKRKIDELGKYTDPKTDEQMDLEYLSRIRPEDVFFIEAPSQKDLAEEAPSQEDPESEDAADLRASDVTDVETSDDMDDAQELDESEIQEEADEMAEKTKRSIGAKASGVDGDATGDAGTKSKRDANMDVGSNVAKRRVKRIGVVGEEAAKPVVKENMAGGLIEDMAVIKLEPKREMGEATSVGAEQGKSAGKAEQDVSAVSNSRNVERAGSEPVKQTVVRRRRRDLGAIKKIYDAESLSVEGSAVNGTQRKRRSLRKKRKLRLKRESEKAKEKEEKKEKEKTDVNEKERKKDKQNVQEKEKGKEEGKKTTRCEKLEANNTDHLMGKRAAHIVDDIDDNNSNNRKMLNTALLLGERGNTMPAGAFEEQAAAADEKSETLNDADVIAADKRAMNAARAAYRRNDERARADNANGREDSYENLLERLRRLSLRNHVRERERERARQRERERDRDREDDFDSSVGEFGNQVFDNLKQSDQYARHFDGLPIDNLWYGNDPWDDDNNNEKQQQKGKQRNEEDMSKAEADAPGTALTIKIEDGEIKSVERKDDPKKSNTAGVISPRDSNEEDDDYMNGDDAAFGWFNKNKVNNNNNTNSKTDENGLVLKVNDQLLNCTAFNTLESFLKSVQQPTNVAGESSAGADDSVSKGGSVNCEGKDNTGTGRSGGEGKDNERQGNERKGMAKFGSQGGGRYGGGMSGGGDSKGGVGMGCGRGGQEVKAPCGRKNGDNDRKSGSDSSGGGADTYGIGGSGNGFGPPDGKCGGGQKQMKLNITINASVMGDKKANNFVGNGTIKVQSEDRERRGITFPQFEEFKRIASKRKCPKPKLSCDERAANSKGALEIVKAMLNMARCNPQMKPLWASLKRNQQCLKKAPPPEGGFEKMQKDDLNHIEDMVEQAMEAISAIIDDQVQQRSCIPLPNELKLLYENILEIYESNSAEGVREKRANVGANPYDEFAKEVRLIDPNSIDERSRIVKKLLRQYDDLPGEEQQQLAGLRDNLQENLAFLEAIKGDQTQIKREQNEQKTPGEQPNKEQQQQQTVKEQSLQLEQEQQQVQQAPQIQQETNNERQDLNADAQSRWQRELLNRLEAEQEDDKEVIKAYNLQYTPEYLRLLKATELIEEKELREAEGIAEN